MLIVFLKCLANFKCLFPTAGHVLDAKFQFSALFLCSYWNGCNCSVVWSLSFDVWIFGPNCILYYVCYWNYFLLLPCVHLFLYIFLFINWSNHTFAFSRLYRLSLQCQGNDAMSKLPENRERELALCKRVPSTSWNKHGWVDSWWRPIWPKLLRNGRYLWPEVMTRF